MINKYLLICSLLILSLDSFGQAQNELRIYYGASSSEFLRNESLIGTGSSEVKDLSEFGIKYLKHLNENIALETGVNYHTSTISIQPAFTGENREVRNENISQNFRTVTMIVTNTENEDYDHLIKNFSL